MSAAVPVTSGPVPADQSRSVGRQVTFGRPPRIEPNIGRPEVRNSSTGRHDSAGRWCSMPSGTVVPRAGRLEVDFLEPLLPGTERDAAETLRREARRRMLARLDEPDLEAGVSAVPEAIRA